MPKAERAPSHNEDESILPPDENPVLRVIDGGKNKQATPEDVAPSQKKRISLSHEQVRELTKDTGTSAPFGDKRYFENSHINTSAENGENRTSEIREEKRRSLEEKQGAELSLSEQISNTRKLVGLRVDEKRHALDRYKSSWSEATGIHNEVKDIFFEGKMKLKALSEEHLDAHERALLETEDLEMERMRLEFEIFWNEKEQYDLETDDANKDKIDLKNACEDIKQKDLFPVLQKLVLAHQKEKELMRASKPQYVRKGGAWVLE